MPKLSEEEANSFPEPTTREVVGGYVRRYWDMVALADRRPCKVIGETGIIRDKPGFEVDLITRASSTEKRHRHDRPSVLMPVTGHWKVVWEGGETVLAPGDTMSVPEDLDHAAWPSMSGDAALFHIVSTDDPAGATWTG